MIYEAVFSSKMQEINITGLTQWDRGQELKISFPEMPSLFQVHFTYKGSGVAYVVQALTADNSATVAIPDIILTQSCDIIAWLYILDAEGRGRTAGKINLPLIPRAKPEDYADTLPATQTQMIENMILSVNDKVDYYLENGGGTYYPDFVREEAEALSEKVLACQNGNTFSFVAVSDMHYSESDRDTADGIDHLGKAIALLRRKCDIDFGVVLGDFANGSSDTFLAQGREDIKSCGAILHEAFLGMPALYCIGSGDSLMEAYSQNGEILGERALYNLISRHSDAVFPESNREAGYCYRDFEESKIRVICLNGSDFGDTVPTDESQVCQMSTAQLEWLCGALNLSSKSASGDWKIMLCCHYPLFWYDKYQQAVDIINAYTAGGSVSITSGTATVSYSFSGVNDAVIIAHIHGHLHNFKVSTLGKAAIPAICIPNADFWRNNEFGDDASLTDFEKLQYSERMIYSKRAFSGDDTAFCVITVDPAAEKIYAHRYGKGYDRIIGFDGTVEVSDSDTPDITLPDIQELKYYTNLVPTALSPTGQSIYNNVGYREGYRLDTTGWFVAAENFTQTGYIAPCVLGDIIRIKGGQWADVEGSYLVLNSAINTAIYCMTLTGVDDPANGTCYDGGVVTIDTGKVTAADLSLLSGFRVSTIGRCGADLIVTVNEEINGALPRTE
ncbi:MAG: hypothetical protein PUC33_07295 [Oscillospiraceae bacterium]|nr:hypothetical protein [Oscillospiraceae bacterium]